MKLEDILKLQDEQQKIAYLKRRSTEAPDAEALFSDWDPMKHSVWDKEKRPDGVKIGQEEVRDSNGKVIQSEETDPDPVNRISLPIEQDQVNIHTAFTVGNEPKLTCEPNNDEEKELFSVIKSINKKNKLRFLNKKIVRSWLSECEVAEYWYTVKDDGFWSKVLTKIKATFGVKTKAEYKLKCAVWSPFRGDKLYPKFDEYGDMVAISREYETTNDDRTKVRHFMTITKDAVYKWDENNRWENPTIFKHGFKKMPVVYSYRKESLCRNIKPIRERLETLLSNFADCIDFNFFPRLVLEGDIVGKPTRSNGDMIKLDRDAKVSYLTWTQTPEQIKMELESLTDKCYSLTGTPRISFENLKGTGQALSGVAFDYVFLSTHLKVDEHNEVIGEHLQRRYNFLVSAVGTLNTSYEKASETIEVECEIAPFRIDDLESKVNIAVAGVGGGIFSKRTGIVMAGIADEVETELAEIESDNAKETEIRKKESVLAVK